MLEQFDKEYFTIYEVHMYNALELAEANVPDDQLIKIMQLQPNTTTPNIDAISRRVKELDYDTFELHKVETTVTRYSVD